jgi:hypothetical protein
VFLDDAGGAQVLFLMRIARKKGVVVMKDTVIVRKNKDIVTRVFDDEAILLPMYKTSDEINCIYNLNKVASRVWELFDGKRTLAEIRGVLLKEYDTTPKELDKELQALLKDLRDIKAIK